MGGKAHAWMDFTNVRIAKSDKKKEKKGVYIIPMLNELLGWKVRLIRTSTWVINNNMQISCDI